VRDGTGTHSLERGLLDDVTDGAASPPNIVSILIIVPDACPVGAWHTAAFV